MRGRRQKYARFARFFLLAAEVAARGGCFYRLADSAGKYIRSWRLRTSHAISLSLASRRLSLSPFGPPRGAPIPLSLSLSLSLAHAARSRTRRRENAGERSRERRTRRGGRRDEERTEPARSRERTREARGRKSERAGAFAWGAIAARHSKPANGRASSHGTGPRLKEPTRFPR